MATTAIAVQPKKKSPLRSAWNTVWAFSKAKPLGAAAGVILIVMIIIAIIAPLIEPYNPLDSNVQERFQAPSWKHLMGTDNLGRDLLSRIIEGTRIALLVGILSSFIGTTAGIILGIISGYLGGRFDLYFQRLMDMIMSFPYLILAMAIVVVFGGSIFNVIMAIAFPMIPTANRVSRSVAMSLKETTFIESARAVGAGQTRIIFRHILPNTVAIYLIVLTSALGNSILAEASLSFLNLGVPPPHPSWGRALNEAMQYFYTSPWMAIFPGIAISLAVFGANLLGDALRDVWDPRLKRI